MRVGPIALFYAASILTMPIGIAATPTCEKTIIAELPSPDGMMSAGVLEYVCRDGGFVTVVSGRVVIVPSGKEANKESEVLVVDTGGRQENIPRIVWASSTLLNITVPVNSLIGLQKDLYSGIRVNVKFEPDDPAARQRFLMELQNLR